MGYCWVVHYCSELPMQMGSWKVQNLGHRMRQKGPSYYLGHHLVMLTGLAWN